MAVYMAVRLHVVYAVQRDFLALICIWCAAFERCVFLWACAPPTRWYVLFWSMAVANVVGYLQW
jgi:hypothetical protein